MGIRVGVIGCGNIARFHFSGLAGAGADVRWVCDLDPERTRPWAEGLGATACTEYEQVLADPEVDAVTVTTASSSHKRICLDAIRAGKAVVCEKTLAMNADEALDIVQAAERQGVVFYTSYMKRFIPAVQKARELLPSLGRILSTHIRAYQCWGDLWGQMPDAGLFHTPPGGASGVRQAYGGGILVCGGSHILDLVTFLLGRPHRLFAHMDTLDGRDYDLQAAALLETNNGVCHFEALAHPLRHIGFLRDGWDERIEINGTNGRLEVFSAAWDQVEYKASLLIHYDSDSGEAKEYRYPPVSPFDRAVAFFCRNIENRTQGEQSRLTGYDVDELIAHMQLSAARGEAVAVNWRA